MLNHLSNVTDQTDSLCMCSYHASSLTVPNVRVEPC